VDRASRQLSDEPSLLHHPSSPALRDSSHWQSESLELARTDTLRAMQDAAGQPGGATHIRRNELKRLRALGYLR
jgi:hypothetical protein